MYDDLITDRVSGRAKNTVPWVIQFVSKTQRESQNSFSQYSVLARYFNGTVRFGWVDRFEDELLSESF